MMQKTRYEVAEILGVTASRVSQIARGLGIRPAITSGIAFYSAKDIRKMKLRNTKPGVRTTNSNSKEKK